MKKIYAILVAACMSISLFAQQPTQADLQSYMEDGYYVACFQAPAGSTCNDIYWVGEYGLGWTVGGALEDYVQCEELAGFAGWYVAKVPANQGTNGKPIQLNECGKLTWDVQPGTAGETALVAGSVTIKPNGAEYDLEGWSTTEPTIITIGAWKNDYNPCELVCEAQAYTIRVYPPYCEAHDDWEPTIKGSFNQWGDAITMEFKGSYFEYVSEPVTASFEFKFNNDAAGSWDHQFEMYDAENDSWHNIPAEGNLTLANAAQFGTVVGNTLTFDFSDDELFRYAGCDEEPADTTHYTVIVGVKVPANAPAAGVELMGTFIEDGWNNGVIMTPGQGEEGWWIAYNVLATEGDEFKVREAGSWANTIMEWKGTEWKSVDNTKFGAVWFDDTYHGDPVKMIELNLSGEIYRWATDVHEGIENVVLTEKAQKVVVDGVLYIIRDNKMYNVQGTQVR